MGRRRVKVGLPITVRGSQGEMERKERRIRRICHEQVAKGVIMMLRMEQKKPGQDSDGR